MESSLGDLPVIGGYQDLLFRDLAPPQPDRESIFDIPDSDTGSVAEDCPSPVTDVQSDEDDDSTMDDCGDPVEAVEGEDWGNSEEPSRPADSKYNPNELTAKSLGDLERVIDCATE
ncbi:hypothetical protein VI817_000195 [Penicillium citrinum]|nr:hypothetical protein VI817_000195 [Penicillium citrinum]